MRSIIRFLSAACLVLASSCSDTPEDCCDNATGSTRFRLTDAPFPYDRVAKVELFVVSVAVSTSPDTSATAPAEFFSVGTVNRKIDLLALHSGLFDEIATKDLAKGAITGVRLVIDTDKSSITMKDGSVLTGSTTPGIAWQSSAGIATLNALIEDRIVVPEGGTDVIIDFDVGRAFIDPSIVYPPSSYQGFIFSPVLRAVQASRTGSVSGVVRLGSSTGPSVADATLELKLGDPNSPEDNWGTVATTRSDANGVFKFAYVTRSGFFPNPNWRYMVVGTKGAAHARSTLPSFSVVGGSDTPVGLVILPNASVSGEK